MSHRIYVTLSTFAEFDSRPLRLLEESGISFSVNPLGRRMKKEEVAEYAADATGIVAGVEPYDRHVLGLLPQLRCISRCGVGIDSIDLTAAEEKGVVVKNTPDVVIQPVAELTVAMIFSLLRRLTEHTTAMQQKQWKKISGNLLAGKKVGVFGLGRIGKKVANMLQALGAHVWATDKVIDQTWIIDNAVKSVELNTLLKECDIITVHIPISEQNKCAIGAQQVKLMKPQSLLINTARGGVVDEQAVYEALQSGHLAGAAFDVYGQEPYQGPLCDVSNVVLTPHVATLTKESRAQMETEAVKNLLEYLLL